MNCFEIKPKSGYGFVYAYTSPSGKKYIGQTSRSLKERAGKNGNDYANCSVFFRAIQKYGFENFSFEILEEVELTKIDERETYYIDYFNSLQPNGYNIQNGGKVDYYERKKRITPVVKYDSQGNFLKYFNSVKEAAEEANCTYQTIEQVLSRKRRHHKNAIYRYVGEEIPEPIKTIPTHGKTVAQYDMNGVFLNSYESANAAALAIGKDSNAGRNIRSVCHNQRQSAYGFKWKFLE